MFRSWVFATAFAFVVAFGSFAWAQLNEADFRAPEDADVLFQIGMPDSRCSEFRVEYSWPGIHDESVAKPDGEPTVKYVVGTDDSKRWNPIHLGPFKSGDRLVRTTYEIDFDAASENDAPLYLILGLALTHPTDQPTMLVSINGRDLEKVKLPKIFEDWRKVDGFNPSLHTAQSVPFYIELPKGSIKSGKNVLTITNDAGNWLFYDYLALRAKREPVKPLELLKTFRKNDMSDVDRIVFAVRKSGIDPHWYANFGYYPTFDPEDRPFRPHDGGALRILDVDSGEASTLIEDSEGSFRDPAVSYDGTKILFSYLKKGTEHYNLYEINVDGTGLRQLTFGDYDDIEPCYLPSGDIAFCSTRCDRFVQCWLTSVATIHRCGPNGENIRPLSYNIEQDNTPNMTPNGQIMYTRWEYVDRSQVHYHHLWVMNVDGTRQSVLFGNRTPNNVFIDARPVPNSDKIALIFSPGHGIQDHRGAVAILDPKLGPDDDSAIRKIAAAYDYCDPYPFSETELMAARQSSIVLLTEQGYEQNLFSLPDSEIEAGYRIFEPRPIIPREREPLTAELPVDAEPTGALVLSDIYAGRKMKDVPRGTVKELLVLETMPEPVHYSGGMDQISHGGTFTLERVVGTIPVTPDGAAAMKLPAGRCFFFVALDGEGRAVKRMHSFTSVMPGETTSCIGCHEERVETPGTDFDKHVFDVASAPVEPTPVEGIPDVFDFPRDIQPLLDKHCVECHNPDRTDGGLDLCGDWTPLYTRSYWNLTVRNMFGDNRNRPMSDFAPYEIGSQASSLYRLVLEGHQGVKFSDAELKTLRFWLETGAPYAGTYAANATGLIGWYYHNEKVENDKDWPETAAMRAAIEKRCLSCHPGNKVPRALSADAGFGRQESFDLSRPEKSRILRAPLAKEADGLGRCVEKRPNGTTKSVFESVDDEDYRTILAGIQRGRDYILNESQRFSTEPFVPNPAYVKAMKRYGVLPEDRPLNEPLDAYKTDREYWKKFDLSRVGFGKNGP